MNKLLSCCLVVAAVAAVSAYDFEDTDYNQLLAQDWEDLEAEYTSVHPRARRDDEAVNAEKCKRRRPKFCCADESLEAIHEQDRATKKECYKQVTGREKHSHGFHGHDPFKCDKEKIEKHKKEFLCVMQCVGQKKNLLDAEGNLKEDEIRKSMKEKFAKELWLTPKLDEMLDKCFTEAKKAPTTPSAKEEDKTACNGVGMRFGHCIWKELQFSCPADQIKDQKACDKVRDRINNHPDFPYQEPRPPADDE